MLLNIPPQKTLLRRHLTTNFNVLIGPEAQQEKRETMESAAYTPLTTTAKVRVGTAVKRERCQCQTSLLCITKKVRNKRGQGEVNSRSATFPLILYTRPFAMYLFQSGPENSQAICSVFP